MPADGARHEVGAVLSSMAESVRKGRSEQAAAEGEKHQPPLAVKLSDIELGQELADHSYSVVTQGTWESFPVAVKRVKIGTSQDLDSFRREIQIMATLDHPGIVHLYGARVLPPDYCMILELGKQQLAERLHTEGWQPSNQELIAVSKQLAAGLRHLHDRGILHRDIKPSNVLFGEDGTAKLVDFSIAQYADDLGADQADRGNLVKGGKPTGGFHKRHMVGTLQYLAPEVLQKRPTTPASDAYAWAITVNEAATGVFPFSDASKDDPRAQTILEFGYSRMELAAAVAAQGLRPTQSPAAPPQLNDLLNRCWQEDPEQRPTAQQIEDELDSISFSASRHDAPSASKAAANGRMTPSQSFTRSQHDAESSQAGPSGPQQSGTEADGDRLFGLSPNQTLRPESLQHSSEAGPGTSKASQHPEQDLGPLQVSGGAHASTGPRDSMEDRHILASPWHQTAPHTHLAAVFDGHRGSAAACFLEAHFAHTLWQHRGSDAPTALKAAFLEVDSAFRRDQDAAASSAQKRSSLAVRKYPGSTAIAALIHGRHLHVANAGDCRAVLCRDGKAQRISRDHNAVDGEERARVTEAGGSCMQINGTWRIGPPGLQVTRSIGDLDLKGQGVVAEPEVHSLFVGDAEQFLILASDGLWEMVSDEQAVTYVQDTVKHPEMAAQRLAQEAFIHGSGDNVTIVVIYLRPVETLEQIYSEVS